MDFARRLLPGLVVPLLVLASAAPAGAQITVNSTNDPGVGVCDLVECTLREAITAANQNPGSDLIEFNIEATFPPNTIQLISELPIIFTPMEIDGTSEPDYAGAPVVFIDGSLLAAGNGLGITADGVTVRALAIHGFPQDGIAITSSLNVVEASWIGLDALGDPDGNGRNGVLIASGTGNRIGGSGAGNVISANVQSGIRIEGLGATGNVIQGNFIGVDPSGSSAVAGQGSGIQLRDGPNNVIGGGDLGEGNVISGNNFGIDVFFASAVIQGNLIGTDAVGMSGLGNGVYGIAITGGPGSLIGGSAPGEGNLISDNAQHGIRLSLSDGALVQGNRIGTDASGAGDLGNGNDGIFIVDTDDSVVGGTGTGEGNIIAFNGVTFGRGVSVSGTGIGNAILSNSIFSNQDLGIDLHPIGITFNDLDDGDPGPNDLQNFPEITTTFVASTQISGTLDSAAGTYRLEFFSSLSCHSSGFGEGQTFLGATSLIIAVAGSTPFSVSFPQDVPVGHAITATATSPAGSTSEFSECATVASASADMDSDGIPDNLDIDPNNFSSDFSDGMTSGRVLGPGDQRLLTFVDEPDPRGIRVLVDELGPDPPPWAACQGEATLLVGPGGELVFTCGSVEVEVVNGPAEAQIGELSFVLPTGSVVTLTKQADGRATIVNDSPGGTDPVQVLSDGSVVAEVEAGRSLVEGELPVERARVKLGGGDDDDDDDDHGRRRGGKDQFDIEGRFVPSSTGDGIDALTEDVAVTLGPFTQVIPAGSLRFGDEDDDEADDDEEADDDGGDDDDEGDAGLAFHGRRGGITLLRIEDDGSFRLKARGIDLGDLDLSEPVPFALRIGDDLGSEALVLDRRGRLREAATAPPFALEPPLRIDPGDLTVRVGEAAVYTIALDPDAASLGEVVRLACEGMPANASCAFSPASLVAGDEPLTATLTVTTASGSEEVLAAEAFGGRGPAGSVWLMLVGVAVLGLVLGSRETEPRRRRTWIPALLILVGLSIQSGCGGDLTAPERPTVEPGTYTFTVVARSVAGEVSAAATLTVQ